MNTILDRLFTAPPFPSLSIPLPARMVPGFRQSLADAFRLAYLAGLRDGFMTGVVLVVLLVVLFTLPRRKPNA